MRLVSKQNSLPVRILGLRWCCPSFRLLIGTLGIAALLPAASVSKSNAAQVMAKLPLLFEVNRGQAPPDVQFVSRGPGYGLSISGTRADWILGGAKAGSSVSMTLAGGSTAARAEAVDPLPARVNYFIGRDTSRWVTDVESYSKIRYRSVYPGIDLVFYGSNGNFEYDFVVSPRADPGRIELRFEGARRLRVTPEGNLEIGVADARPLVMKKPVVYQEAGGTRRLVASAFRLKGKRAVTFSLGQYDRSRALVIDPVLAYATYLGGSDWDRGFAIAIDSSGRPYIAGDTASGGFLGASSATPVPGVPHQWHAFLARLNAAGTAVEYLTIFGGSGGEQASSVAIDSSGNVWVGGFTASTDFPLQHAVQTSLAGSGTLDAFVTEFSPSGALLGSTYLGGSGNELYPVVIPESAGIVAIAGSTESSNFPIVSGALQPSFGGGQRDCFVSRLDLTHGSLLASTYLGGPYTDMCTAIARDSSGNYYVAGHSAGGLPVTGNAYQQQFGGNQFDGFVSKWNSSLNGLLNLSYLGGNGVDILSAMTVGPDGSVYLAGTTDSTNFPLANPAQNTMRGYTDGFVTRLAPDLHSLVFSTYLGGSWWDQFYAITLDTAGNVIIGGITNSPDFPLVNPALPLQPADAILVKLPPSGAPILFSTPIGGWQIETFYGVAVDSANNIYATGNSSYPDFPVLNALQPVFGGSGDAIVVKMSDPGPVVTTGPGVASQPVDSTTGTSPVTMTFSNVTQTGSTSLSTAPAGPPPPQGFKIGNPPTYFDISTTASFSGPVTVCISYAGVSYANESKIRLLHYENGAWVDVTTSVNTATKIVCGSVSSFSPFALVEPETQAPVASNVQASPNPVPYGLGSTLTAQISDVNTGNSRIASATYNVDGGAWLPMSAVDGSFNLPSENVTAPLAPLPAGVHNVCVKGKDGPGNESAGECLLLAVYDPSAGFVTGGGWILSPPGAYSPVPSLTGKATFGFVSLYQKGATVPSGKTEFVFREASFVFASTSYDWLVVAGARAQFKGSGTIGGSGDYAFLLTAMDGQVNGGGGVDRMRIKIWNKQTGGVIYDNQPGAPDTGSDSTELGGGSIVIRSN